MRTNEAGAGETLSCGSTSAASANFNIKDKSILKIISAGGELSIRKINGKLEMVGQLNLFVRGYMAKKIDAKRN